MIRFSALFLCCAVFAQDEPPQQLLEKFAPTLILSQGECDALPAEFTPGLAEPVVLSKNGTLYGQAFKNGDLIELHYYHLWSRDCGPLPHALDAEHVSVVISREGKALYWYAAAHEDTACDASHAMRAAALDAEERGARIWVSKGKHASFLKQEFCARGCGGDSCIPHTVLKPSTVINLGERDSPLNGALWIHSDRWPLKAKFATDFSEPVLAQLSAIEDDSVISFTGPARQPVQALALAGASTNSALSIASGKTDNALQRSGANTGRALGKSAVNVGRSLNRSRKAAFRWVPR